MQQIIVTQKQDAQLTLRGIVDLGLASTGSLECILAICRKNTIDEIFYGSFSTSYSTIKEITQELASIMDTGTLSGPLNEPLKLGKEQIVKSFYGQPLISENDKKLGYLILLNAENKVNENTTTIFSLMIRQAIPAIRLYTNETELYYPKTRYRNFFEKSQGLMCTHSLRGELLDFNHASAESLGYKYEELIGKSLYDIVPSKYKLAVAKYLHDIVRNGASTGMMYTQHKDGSERVWLYKNNIEQDLDGSRYVLGNAVDITKHYHLEFEYNRLKELLEQTNIVARVGGWEVDMLQSKVYWTDLTKEIHEVPKYFVPELETAINFYKEGEDRERISKAIERAIKEQTPWDLDLRVITAKGREIWVRAIGQAEVKDGVCTRLFGTFQDIDEKKKTALEISESRKLLKNVLQSASDVSIIATDTSGVITLFNSGAEKLLGYTAEEVVGKQTPVIIHDLEEVVKRGEELSAMTGEDISGFKTFVYKSELEGLERREWQYIRKDGSRFPVSLVVTPMRDTNNVINGYLGIAIDISEQKKARESLNIERARLSAFVTFAPAAVAMFDRDIRYIAYSNRWLEEYQLNGKSLINRSHYEIFPNISDEWKDIHQRCLAGEVVSSEEDVWTPAGWDHPQYLRWEVRPWYQFDGTIGGIMMLTQDITESCLQREELKKAKQAAEQANKAKSEFLANMSHEIRTPLNGVIGFTDLVMKTELSDTQQQYISIVNQSANALLSIINDILDFSKIEAGKLELDIDKSDLYELCNQATDIVTYQVHKKGLEMLLNIPPDLPRNVWIDNVRIKQVLVNLLGNAVKFTEKGEIELKVTPLEESTAEKHIKLRFSVKDTGIGIRKDTQRKIFESFSQADISTTKKYGGTGLGLTISNSLLELMNSKLELLSELGEGSEFYFDIELDYEHGDGDAEDLSEYAEIHKVLIVDDNINNRLILKQMMALKHIEADEAANGFEALQHMMSGAQYDVIIMDYHMPIMNGLETIRKIRENFSDQGQKQAIVFLHSSSDDETILQQCKELEVRHRLIKPIKIQEMYDTLLKVSSHQAQSSKADNLGSSSISYSDKPVRILIVEDNTVNMLLAKSVVKRILPNSKIFEATNGLKAVEQCSENLPDFILMDIQMPEMNGYEASRHIRELSQGHKHIPIIALTAGNLKGQKEKCLEAGMDDFIPKPFVESDLVRVFEQYFEQEKSAQEELLDRIEKEVAFDSAVLHNFLGDDLDDAEIINTVLQTSIEELNDAAAKINAHPDFPELRKIAHKLYGTASAVGLQQLGALCKQLEIGIDENKEEAFLLQLKIHTQEKLTKATILVTNYLNR